MERMLFGQKQQQPASPVLHFPIHPLYRQQTAEQIKWASIPHTFSKNKLDNCLKKQKELLSKDCF